MNEHRIHPWGLLPEWARRMLGWSTVVLVTGLAAFAVLWAIVQLQLLFVPLLCALLGLALVRKPFDRLAATGVPQGISALLATAMLLVVVGGAAIILGSAMAATWGDIQNAAVSGAERVDGALPTAGPESAPAEDPTGPLAGGVRDLLTTADRSVASLSRGIVDGVSVAVQVVAFWLLTLTLVFHLLKDGPRWWMRTLGGVGTSRSETAREVGELAFTALATYIRGSALIAFIDASVVFLVLLALGVPHAAGLAALVFFGAFVPYAGAILSGSIAVLSALATAGTGTAAAVAGALVLVQAFDSTVLTPWIQSRGAKLHPVIVLVALVTGATLAGIVGTLVAVPVAAVVQMSLTRSSVLRPATGTGDETAGDPGG